MPRAAGRRPPWQEDETLVRRARGSISWRPERKAYFVRWVAPDGTRRQLRGGKTIEEAQDVLDAVFEDETSEAQGKPIERLLDEFLGEEHLPALRTRLAPKVFVTRKARLLAVAKMLGTKPMCEVRRVDADRVFVELTTRRYRVPAKKGKRRKPRQRSPSTLFQYKSALVVCWNAAIDAGLAKDNPWRGVKLPRQQEFAVPYLSEDDLRALYKAADARLRPFLILLGETGLRRGEGLALKWKDVAPDLSTVTVARSKSGRVRAVPLTELARMALRGLAGKTVPRTEERVFSDIGESWTIDTRNAWRATLGRSGLPRIRLHDLRHARASLLVRAGVPVPTVSAWLGHATPQLVLVRYGHHAPQDHLQRALAILEETRTAARPDAPRPSGGFATSDLPGTPQSAPAAQVLELSRATP